MNLPSAFAAACDNPPLIFEFDSPAPFPRFSVVLFFFSFSSPFSILYCLNSFLSCSLTVTPSSFAPISASSILCLCLSFKILNTDLLTGDIVVLVVVVVTPTLDVVSVVVVTPTLVSVVTPTLALAFLSLPETTPLSDANFVGFLPVGLYPLKVAKAFFISGEFLI